jgi:hypothetical protein
VSRLNNHQHRLNKLSVVQEVSIAAVLHKCVSNKERKINKCAGKMTSLTKNVIRYQNG